MSRITSRQHSFADLELQSQGIVLEPLLQGIAQLLDQHGELVTLIHQDLVRGLRCPRTGRCGMDAAQVLRAFVLQRVKNWDLRELRERIADGYTLRCFTTFFSGRVPKHNAFHRAFCRLTPATLRALNEVVVQVAVDLGLEDGQQLRVDTTVVETDIHFPTDSTLLWDAVRVITRTTQQLQQQVPLTRAVPFTNRTRSARRRMQELQRMSPRQRHDQQRPTYRALIRVSEQVVENARAVIAMTPLLERAEAQPVVHYCELADRAIDQARRRVLLEEMVPVADKLFSIFEPHTDLIMRGKAQKPVEFGHKLFLAESRIGLITDYRVLEGNPPDEQRVAASLEHHQRIFGAAPRLFAADRGFYSAANLETCHQAGVAAECVPQRGGTKTPQRSTYEKSRSFRRGQRFRAGIEGRISVLGRGRGMKRCLLEGRERFEVFVGAAVLANNLLIIAERLQRRSVRRRAAA